MECKNREMKDCTEKTYEVFLSWYEIINSTPTLYVVQIIFKKAMHSKNIHLLLNKVPSVTFLMEKEMHS